MSRPDNIGYAEHASDIVAKAAGLATGNRPFALITSRAIEGWAARRRLRCRARSKRRNDRLIVERLHRPGYPTSCPGGIADRDKS